MSADAWVLIGLITLVLIVHWGIRFGKRAAQLNRKIDADVAFLRAIPGGVEW